MVTLVLAVLLQQEVIVARMAVTIPVLPATQLAASPCIRRHFFNRSTSAALHWTASPDLVPLPTWAPSGYWVYRGQGGNPKSYVALNAKQVTIAGYTDTTAKKHTTYSYYVVAAIGKVLAKPSNIAVVTFK